VSPAEFNEATRLPVILPITNGGDFASRLNVLIYLCLCYRTQGQVNFHVIPRHENLLVFRLVDKMVFHEFPHVRMHITMARQRRTGIQSQAERALRSSAREL
jgi:hypothetical protein